MSRGLRFRGFLDVLNLRYRIELVVSYGSCSRLYRGHVARLRFSSGATFVNLVRVQRLLRENAIAERDYFNDMVEKYGGVELWTEQIKKDARWIRSAEYEDYHAEDEISYNAKQGIETLSDLAESIHALAKHVSEIVSLSEKKLNSDSKNCKRLIALKLHGPVLHPARIFWTAYRFVAVPLGLVLQKVEVLQARRWSRI